MKTCCIWIKHRRVLTNGPIRLSKRMSKCDSAHTSKQTRLKRTRFCLEDFTHGRTVLLNSDSVSSIEVRSSNPSCIDVGEQHGWWAEEQKSCLNLNRRFYRRLHQPTITTDACQQVFGIYAVVKGRPCCPRRLFRHRRCRCFRRRRRRRRHVCSSPPCRFLRVLSLLLIPPALPPSTPSVQNSLTPPPPLQTPARITRRESASSVQNSLQPPPFPSNAGDDHTSRMAFSVTPPLLRQGVHPACGPRSTRLRPNRRAWSSASCILQGSSAWMHAVSQGSGGVRTRVSHCAARARPGRVQRASSAAPASRSLRSAQGFAGLLLTDSFRVERGIGSVRRHRPRPAPRRREPPWLDQ